MRVADRYEPGYLPSLFTHFNCRNSLGSARCLTRSILKRWKRQCRYQVDPLIDIPGHCHVVPKLVGKVNGSIRRQVGEGRAINLILTGQCSVFRRRLSHPQLDSRAHDICGRNVGKRSDPRPRRYDFQGIVAITGMAREIRSWRLGQRTR